MRLQMFTFPVHADGESTLFAYALREPPVEYQSSIPARSWNAWNVFFFVSLLIFVCRVIDLCRRRCRFHSICCRLFLFRRRLSRAFAVISDRSETCFRLLLGRRFFFFAGPYRMQECLTGRRETESERASGLRNVNFNSE